MSLSPGELLGRYEIQALLGAGSMGEVYRATDTRLGRDVAIKVLLQEFSGDPERLGRFQREARAASSLNHPNIVSVLDVGEHESSPYLVTELLEGEPLSQRCARGPIPLAAALEISLPIARGLAAAHGKGIVHRDIKPENVFILSDGRIKILDFGLAKLLDPAGAESGAETEADPVVTTAGVALGTVDYMSPEQMRGLPADHRTDLFSFGALLHEMLTASPPFRRESATDTFAAILDDDPPSLSKCGVKAPSAVQKLLLRCLEKKLEARMQSAAELVSALEAITAAADSSRKGSAAGSSGIAGLVGRIFGRGN